MQDPGYQKSDFNNQFKAVYKQAKDYYEKYKLSVILPFRMIQLLPFN